VPEHPPDQFDVLLVMAVDVGQIDQNLSAEAVNLVRDDPVWT
jgi:hypothetical protein